MKDSRETLSDSDELDLPDTDVIEESDFVLYGELPDSSPLARHLDAWPPGDASEPTEELTTGREHMLTANREPAEPDHSKPGGDHRLFGRIVFGVVAVLAIAVAVWKFGGVP